MRFLGVAGTGDLAAPNLRLAAQGHEVKAAIPEPLARGAGAGLIDRVDDWRAEPLRVRQTCIAAVSKTRAGLTRDRSAVKWIRERFVRAE